MAKAVTELTKVLADLKASATPKDWAEPPAGFVVCLGYMLTCCVENNLLVLGISLASPEACSTSDFLEAVVAVFGEPQATFERNYPKRGLTTLFQWKVE